MAAPAAASGAIVPAQLGFLAIFNPSLGSTDDTIDDQIVYYASATTQHAARKRRHKTTGRPTDVVSQEERNERLRQIGLAQGMINFSRGFADGASLDGVDTDKARVVTHELEPGWWVIAVSSRQDILHDVLITTPQSIDFTKVPLPPRLPIKSEAQAETHEYSSREVKPGALILRDLLRAHSIFLMHHDTSLSAMFVRTRRDKSVAVLGRYWDLFLSTWSVMVHGNPARDILGGINVAASGELGVGVGEEERGSGEREVLEGLVGRIEGLVDLVVAKFGEEEENPAATEVTKTPWLGSGREPAAEDGAIFLGAGALSRKSVRDVSHWMEDLYQWGEHAYGVIDSPTSTRRPRRTNKPDDGSTALPAGEPAERAVKSHEEPSGAPDASELDDGALDKMLGYMKLGYGSYWTIPGTGGSATPEPPNTEQPSAIEDQAPRRPKLTQRTSSDALGHYLIGLKGSVEEEPDDASDSEPRNSRTVLRTIHVELEGQHHDVTSFVRDLGHPSSSLAQSQVTGNMLPGYDSHNVNKAEKLRVVVYANRPFLFVFLFRLRTDSLAWDGLYRSLHYQLAPLKKPLLASTRYRPDAAVSAANSTIYNLVWDPPALTVRSTIPNIPDVTNGAGLVSRRRGQHASPFTEYPFCDAAPRRRRPGAYAQDEPRMVDCLDAFAGQPAPGRAGLARDVRRGGRGTEAACEAVGGTSVRRYTSSEGRAITQGSVAMALTARVSSLRALVSTPGVT